MHKYTYTNMYIIKKIISCRFILCLDLTSLLKPYEKSCRRRKVKIEKILTVTYRTLLTKTTNFLKSGEYKMYLDLKIISYSKSYQTYSGIQRLVLEKPTRPYAFYASFRNAANANRTPYLTRKVKNCNAPKNKIKSAMF